MQTYVKYSKICKKYSKTLKTLNTKPGLYLQVSQCKESQANGIAGLQTGYKALNFQKKELNGPIQWKQLLMCQTEETLAGSLLPLPELPDAKKEFKTAAMKL